MKHAFILAAATALCAIPAVTLANMGNKVIATGNTITVGLQAENDSGETGTATLKQIGDDILVTVNMKNPTAPVQPMHIHTGQCGATLNPKPQYPLKNVTDGISKTKLSNMKLSDLETGGFAINVHKSSDAIATYVACGNIPKT